MVHHNKYTKKRSHSNKDGTRRNKYVYKGGENTLPQEENTQPTEESSQPSLLGTIGNSFNSTMGKLSEAVSGTPSKENTVTPDKQNTVTPQLQTSPPVTPPNEKVDDNEMEEMKSYTMELVNTLKEKENIENKLTSLLATMPAVFNEPIQEETSLVNDETMSSSDEEESQQDDMSVEGDEKTSQQDEDEEDNTSVKSEEGSQENNMSVQNDEEGSPVSFNPNEQEKEEQ